MKETILITLLLFISLLYNSYSNEAVSPQNSNSKTSIDQLKHLAESGDATAQFQIANILWKGEGVQENDLEAKKWFEKSALNGNPEAQEIIGGIYFQRYPFEGVDEYDVKKAIYWYNKAAEKNNVDAMTELATIYWFGKGVPINIDLSQGYVQKVFDTMSSTNIASLSARFIQLCSSETNVTSNETYRFLEKFWVPAANSGEVASANRLGDAYSYGEIQVIF
jgi:TPR repeat protein